MNRKNVWLWASLALTVVAFAVTGLLWTRLPEEVPIHWNGSGDADEYGPRPWILLCPGLMLLFLAMFPLLEWSSPKPFSVESFRSTFYYVGFLIVAIAGYVFAVTLWATLVGPVNGARTIGSGVCLMFALLGNELGKVRRNLWMGIRTPWSLASDRVWNETHRLGARMFFAAGVIGCAACLLVPGSVAVVTVLVAVFAAALVPVAFSCIRYKQLERAGALGNNDP